MSFPMFIIHGHTASTIWEMQVSERLSHDCCTITLVSNISRGKLLDAQSLQEAKRGALEIVGILFNAQQ